MYDDWQFCVFIAKKNYSLLKKGKYDEKQCIRFTGKFS